MHVTTVVIPTRSARSRPVPRVPRCPATRLTKPECHCPACLLEQMAAHGKAAPGAAPRAAGSSAPAQAGVIL